MLLSHDVCFFGQLRYLFVGKLAIFSTRLLVGKSSDLHDPVNKLSEFSASNKTLNHLDTPKKFLLFNRVLLVNLLNQLSDIWVNLFQCTCLDFTLLKFVYKHSRLNQLSKFSASYERLNSLYGFPALRLLNRFGFRLLCVLQKGSLERILSFFFLLSL